MKTLKPKQQKFLLALVSEPTVKKAYEVAKISHTTAYNWLSDTAFRRAYQNLKRDILKTTTAKLQGYSQRAVDSLVEILNDEQAPAHTKVQSARTILEYAYKSFELEDLATRLDELEEAHERNLIN